ncbi:MAG: response regulator transcription factor [Candidatus Obscuribacterales bacterium]
MSDDTISIYLVEDNELIRSAVSVALNGISGFKVVGEAADGATAIDQILASPPDLALVDIGLPKVDGIEVTKTVKQQLPSLKAIMLTSHDSDEDMFASFQAGANGYIIKDGFSKAKLEVAIRTVNSGSSWLDPLIAQRVLQVAENADKLNLTRNEKSYLEKVAHGDLKENRAATDQAQALKELADDHMDEAWDSFMNRLMGFKQSTNEEMN